MSYDAIQNEWTLLFFSSGSKVPLILPEAEIGEEHDPQGHGAVLRTARLKADVAEMGRYSNDVQ